MDGNKLEQSFLNIENTIDVLQRELIHIVPAIKESLEKNEVFKTELGTEMNRLIEIIDSREKSFHNFVEHLQPYFMTIKAYQELTPTIRNAIDEGIIKIGQAEKTLLKFAELIPKETLVKTKHSLDYKSISIVCSFQYSQLF